MDFYCFPKGNARPIYASTVPITTNSPVIPYQFPPIPRQSTCQLPPIPMQFPSNSYQYLGNSHAISIFLLHQFAKNSLPVPTHASTMHVPFRSNCQEKAFSKMMILGGGGLPRPLYSGRGNYSSSRN